MKQAKQFIKLAKIAKKSAATMRDINDVDEHLNLAAAFEAQADVLKKQKTKTKKKK